MKKRILQLTGARREYLYTHIKSHWKTLLTPTQFPESHQAQTFPIGSLKVSFHTETFVNTEETLSDAQFTLISTVITWVPSRLFHSHSLVCLPRFPAGSCLFQLKNKKQKSKIYINHSDLTDRTGHWIENQCLKYIKKVLCFQTEWDRQR